MSLYSYDGPVMVFEKCVATHWKAATLATSEKSARSHLVYQYKRDNGLAVNSKITLPGKIILEEVHLNG